MDEKGEKENERKWFIQPREKIKVLDTGYCLGLLYYILNLGTHPVAYIKTPKRT